MSFRPASASIGARHLGKLSLNDPHHGGQFELVQACKAIIAVHGLRTWMACQTVNLPSRDSGCGTPPRLPAPQMWITPTFIWQCIAREPFSASSPSRFCSIRLLGLSDCPLYWCLWSSRRQERDHRNDGVAALLSCCIQPHPGRQWHCCFCSSAAMAPPLVLHL